MARLATTYIVRHMKGDHEGCAAVLEDVLPEDGVLTDSSALPLVAFIGALAATAVDLGQREEMTAAEFERFLHYMHMHHEGVEIPMPPEPNED